MLRISQPVNSGRDLTVKLEGRIVGPWVNELQLACLAFLNVGRVLNLDLSQVTYADLEGSKLLVSLKSHGVKLKACSPFISEQLRAIEESESL
jgi:hypothetical protein